jgi:hypothetical protein
MNAADLYRTAFAALPEADIQAYSQLMGRDGPKTERLLERGRDALAALDAAASCPECDWGQDGSLAALSDEISGARSLAMLASLRAEAAFRAGDVPNCQRSLIGIMRLARNLGRGLYIAGLSGFAIESIAVHKALEMARGLDQDGRRLFAKALESLPPLPSLAEAMRAEQVYYRSEYRDGIMATDEDDLPGFVRQKFGLETVAPEPSPFTEWIFPDGDPAELMLNAAGGSRAALLELVDEVLAAYDALIHSAEQDDDDPAARLPALEERAAQNPLLKEQLRTLEMMRPAWKRHRERLAELEAAVRG